MNKHTLPELGYTYNALEPFIDAKTMEIHHTKHHQAYTDKFNAALEKHEELFDKTALELLTDLNAVPEDIRTAVRNNGGGFLNHSFFWQTLKINNGILPQGLLMTAIEKSFGTFDIFKELFSTSALSHFGSGWTWLVANEVEELSIISLPNQDSPLSLGLKPLLNLDVWEHAYYLNYQNKRADYIAAWWNIINWEQVAKNLI